MTNEETKKTTSKAKATEYPTPEDLVVDEHEPEPEQDQDQDLVAWANLGHAAVEMFERHGLKAVNQVEERLTVLEIIERKNVNLLVLAKIIHEQQQLQDRDQQSVYNCYVGYGEKLTKQEFMLLKGEIFRSLYGEEE